MGRRLLQMPGMPALLVSAATAVAFALWDPPVRDLAAHTFRADFFDQYGPAIWNGTWYGGHYMPTYSVLFPPLAALLDPVWAGALAAIASGWLFDRLVAGRWGPRAAPAGLWFAALGVPALLANGWLAFSLGVALALASLLALQRGRKGIALLFAVLCGLASPVAALLLALVAATVAVAGRRRGPALVAALALLPVAVLALLFPEAGGRFPLWFSAYWPLALTCIGAVLFLRNAPEERDLRVVAVVYLAAGTLLWLVPNPVGGNITRLGSLFAGPVLAAVLLAGRARPSRALAVAVLALALGWQVITPLPDTLQSLGDPSTERSYYEPLNNWLAGRGAERDRIEVVYTFNHWETAHVSPRFALARGWLRQLDRERNSLFYEGRLTGERYRRWLIDKGVRYVALSDAELDYSAEKEADLVRAGQPYLRQRAALKHWRVYEVTPAPSLLEGPPGARLVSQTPQSFTVEADRTGRWLVRTEPTAYRHLVSGEGCVGKEGDWTVLRVDRPGRLEAKVAFSPARAVKAILHDQNDC